MWCGCTPDFDADVAELAAEDDAWARSQRAMTRVTYDTDDDNVSQYIDSD